MSVWPNGVMIVGSPLGVVEGDRTDWCPIPLTLWSMLNNQSQSVNGHAAMFYFHSESIN